MYAFATLIRGIHPVSAEAIRARREREGTSLFLSELPPRFGEEPLRLIQTMLAPEIVMARSEPEAGAKLINAQGEVLVFTESFPRFEAVDVTPWIYEYLGRSPDKQGLTFYTLGGFLLPRDSKKEADPIVAATYFDNLEEFQENFLYNVSAITGAPPETYVGFCIRLRRYAETELLQFTTSEDQPIRLQ